MNTFQRYIIVNSTTKNVDGTLRMWSDDISLVDLNADQSVVASVGRLADTVNDIEIIDYYYDGVDDVCYEKAVMTPAYTSVDQPFEFDGYVDVSISSLPTGYIVKPHSSMVVQASNTNNVTVRLSGVGDYRIQIYAPQYKVFEVPITVVDNRGDNRAVTAAEIKAKRNELEESAITVMVNAVSRTFDGDVLSLSRMGEQIRRFDSLPTVVGGELAWGLSDGSIIHMTKTELQTAYDDIRDAKADRRADLHDRARTIMALPKPTQANIKIMLGRRRP